MIPTNSAIKDGGISVYSFLSSLKVFPFFYAFLFILPIVGNIDFTNINFISIYFIDSTISCPTHGIALIRLVITVAKSSICSSLALKT